MIRVADYIIDRLHQASVEHIFMVTGRGMLFLSDAVAAHKGISDICMHHEQSTSYAAMAYAQANQKIGVSMVSTGCAATNAITGALCAWQDDIPCVFISGQNKLNETTRHTKLPIRTYGQQEADIIAMVEPITKYAVMLDKAEDAVYEMEKALYLAQHGRKGPVWIDVPLDIQNQRIEPSDLRSFKPPKDDLPQASEADVNAVFEALEKAERPVVLMGSGVRSSGSEDALQDFIEQHQLPLVYGNSSADVLATDHPLSMGCVGAMASNRSANFALQNSDLVLVLGCRMTTLIMGEQIDKFARAADIIAVDIDEHEHQKFPEKINKMVHSDLALFFAAMASKDTVKTAASWTKRCAEWKADFPKCEERYMQSEIVDIYELAHILSDHIDEDAIVVTDSGLEELLIPTTMNFSKENRCLHPHSQGAMGYALPAAIGAYTATGKQVVVVVGDGSVMMNIQELQTISYHKMPIKIIIVNNDCYAVIRKRQEDLFRTRTIGTDAANGVACPDFEKVAHGFDINFRRIDTTTELKENLGDVMAMNGAVICEVMAKEDQCYIHSSHRKGEKGRFVQPPIEDQSPFLERDVFLKNMIIDPIDL